MHHLGDITKIDGHKVPITDVVIGGSPCQDLSVAGKRAGLDGERSGLFMEQIRVIKEMRDEDRRNGRTDVFVRPRYMVWENVPGALSSGQPKGEDFRIVLEETARVADPNASIPRPKDGKWTTSGCILGDGWSIAWRILDLQFWGATYFDDEGVPTKLGTPQRRRRIALVADFNGGSAGQILFESNSSVGDFAESGNEGQGTPGDTEESIAESGISFQERAGKPGGGKGILTQVGHTGAIVSGNTQNVVSFDPGANRYLGATFNDVAKTLAQGTAPGFHDAVAYESPDTHTHTHTAFAESGFSKWEQGEQSIPIRASGGCIGGGSETLVAEDSRDPVC